MMNEFIDNLVKNKNYSEELARTLKEILPTMIYYYGTEYLNYFCEVLSNSTIHICSDGETIFDFINSVDNNVNNDQSFVQEKELRMASGVCSAVPTISYNDGKYTLDNVSYYVGIANCSLESDYGKRTLIHELSHLFKAYKDTFRIDKDICYERSGFIEITSKLSYSNGNVIQTVIEEKNVGLEEGFNANDEAEIASIMTSSAKENSGYSLEADIADSIDSGLKLKKERLQAQFGANTNQFIDKYNSYSNTDCFKDLSYNVDELVKADYESMANIFLYLSEKEEDKEKIKNINNRKEMYYLNSIKNVEAVKANLASMNK